MSWDTNPLYSLLHESIYCQGAASNWAAQRVIETEGLAAKFDAVSTAEAGGCWKVESGVKAFACGVASQIRPRYRR